MARKYSDVSIMNLESGSDALPMEKKRKKISALPTCDLAIDSSWDSIEGMDANMRNSLAGLTKKRK